MLCDLLISDLILTYFGAGFYLQVIVVALHSKLNVGRFERF